MLQPEACFIRTRLNVGLMRRYLQATNNDVPKYAAHPTKPPITASDNMQKDNDTNSDNASAQLKPINYPKQ